MSTHQSQHRSVAYNIWPVVAAMMAATKNLLALEAMTALNKLVHKDR